jgi:hypothetical protein
VIVEAMTQDRESGAAGCRWGLETGKRIMRRLGAQSISRNSNECRLGDEIVVIKCSSSRTGKLSVSYPMLKRIAAVIGAFAKNSSEFDLYRLSPEDCERNMTPRTGRRFSSGRVGMVNHSVFFQLGKHLGAVDISKTE